MTVTLTDPTSLTRAQRAALVLAGGRPLLRGARRWYAGEASFAPDTIRALVRLGLAHETVRHGRAQIEPTGAGRAVLAVIEARRERQARLPEKGERASQEKGAGTAGATNRQRSV